MSRLTAFDVAFRGTLAGDLSDVVKDALKDSRVLTVSVNSPAVTLGEHADAIHAEVVNVVDDSYQIVGYIFPGWVARQVRANVTSANFMSIVTLSEAIDVLEKERRIPGRKHLHEWLNSDQPTERICPGNGKPHPTFWKPCLQHGT